MDGFHFKKHLKNSEIIVFHQQDYGLSLKFQQTKNPFSLAGMKDWEKKMVSASQKINFYQLKYAVFLKLACSSFSDGFHQEEKPMNKRKRFPLARKSISTNWMKDYVEKYFTLDEIKLLLVGISEKWRKNGLHQPKNQLSTCRNNLFLAGIFLKNWILPNFNYAFHKQK